MAADPTVLVLTPVKDAVPCLKSYVSGLRQLTYDHECLSVALLESDSTDGTYEQFERALRQLNGDFASARIWKRDFGFRLPPGTPRWAPGVQVERRATLARSRNHLLFRALDEHDWVLWLDVDVIEYPPDVIQRLLATGKDIVQPHCVKEYGGPTYDRNAWRDHGRLCMGDLRGEGELTRLDAVGGTMLLVRGDVHREGLVFPTYFHGRANPLVRRDNRLHGRWKVLQAWRGDYRGEIETEGLGILARDMGYQCWGMPHLEIRHRDA